MFMVSKLDTKFLIILMQNFFWKLINSEIIKGKLRLLTFCTNDEEGLRTFKRGELLIKVVF